MKKSTLIRGIAGVILLVVFMLVMAFKGRCQTMPYAADRPGMGYTPYLVGLNQIDYNVSVGHAYYAPSNCEMHNQFYMTNSFRYGAFKHLELRIGVDVGAYTRENYSSGELMSGVRALTVGVKIPIIRDVKWLPDIGILAQTQLPDIGITPYTIANYIPSASVLLQKQFGKFYAVGNVGVLWDALTGDGCYYMHPWSTDTYTQGSYSLAVGYYILDNVGIFFETYGYYSMHTEPLASCDFGLFVGITPELQWDLSGGCNYKYGRDYSFINTGIAWRIPHNSNKHKQNNNDGK